MHSPWHAAARTNIVFLQSRSCALHSAKVPKGTQSRAQPRRIESLSKDALVSRCAFSVPDREVCYIVMDCVVGGQSILASPAGNRGRRFALATNRLDARCHWTPAGNRREAARRAGLLALIKAQRVAVISSARSSCTCILRVRVVESGVSPRRRQLPAGAARAPMGFAQAALPHGRHGGTKAA